MLEMEWELQRKVLWMKGINYLIDAPIEAVSAAFGTKTISATRGYVRSKGLFTRVIFEGKEYTAFSGQAENSKEDLLKFKINTIAGGDTRVALGKFMKEQFDKHGGVRVDLVSVNEMTYKVI